MVPSSYPLNSNNPYGQWRKFLGENCNVSNSSRLLGSYL